MIEKLLIPHIPEKFTDDPGYRAGHIRVINPLPGTRILGLHIPEMKKIARELARSQEALSLHGSFLAETVLFYEEKIVWGLMLDYMKVPLEKRLEMFSGFVPRIDNWAICDTVCAAARWISSKEAVWDYLQQWWDSCREFEVRFALIMSMSYFLDGQWLPEVFRRVDSLDFSRISSDYVQGRRPAEGTVSGPAPYYVRMGTAWLLATSLAKFPDRTRAYARGSKLPEDVLKLYVCKARESFRTRTVSPF